MRWGPLYGLFVFAASLLANLCIGIVIFVPMAFYFGEKGIPQFFEYFQYAPKMVFVGTFVIFSFVYLFSDYYDFKPD